MTEAIELKKAIANVAAARALPFRLVEALVKLGKLTPEEGKSVIDAMLDPPTPGPRPSISGDVFRPGKLTKQPPR